MKVKIDIAKSMIKQYMDVGDLILWCSSIEPETSS